MDKYDKEDLGLWENPEMSSNSQHVIWRFGTEQLYVCGEDRVFVVDLDKHVQTELALFSIFYSFWTAVPILAKRQPLSIEVGATIRYHQRLYAEITATLLKSKGQQRVTPSLLWPWLKRTLCLFNHDAQSRKKFSQIKCPSQLLESTVTDIISRPQFQGYLKKFTTPVMGSERFQWTSCTPPWCLQTLVRQMDSNERSYRGRASKGVFILPHEALEMTWDIYMDMPNFHRCIAGCNLKHSSFRRLGPNYCLDDEVINTYIALLPIRPHTPRIKVTNTWVFAKLQMMAENEAHAFKYLLGHKKSNESIDEILAKVSKIVIPINWGGDHWLTVVLDVKDKLVLFMDSLARHTGKRGRGSIFDVLKKKIPLSHEWKLKEGEGVPQQANSFDCGVYCCQLIKYTYFCESIPEWEATDIVNLRRMMVMEMYEGSLRWFSE